MTTNQNSAQNTNTAIGSLYVGDLHPDVTESMLHDKFTQIGPVLSIRVCRDMVTRKSLGYAYVNYQEPTHAEMALDRMNFDSIKGRTIRIMWSQRDPFLRKSGLGNIFIKNLEKSIEQKELYDTFMAFGPILSCKIATDENGSSKGYGFVHFQTEEAALNAIDAVNTMLVNNKKVYVGKFIPKSERNSSSNSVKFTNCYVKNFGEELDDNKLMELFEKFGEITSAKVMADERGKSKGFGFVCFKEPAKAEEAVKEMNGSTVGDRTISVCRAQKKAERTEELKHKFEKQREERTARYGHGVNLYVKQLDDTIDDKRLEAEFSKFGKITSAKVMTDNQNKSKGFGFVCFSHPDEATRAVTEMNQKILGTKPLYVTIAQRKEDRKAQLANQYIQRVTQGRSGVPPASAMNPMLPPIGGNLQFYLQNPRFYGNQFMQQHPTNNRNMPGPRQMGNQVPQNAMGNWNPQTAMQAQAAAGRQIPQGYMNPEMQQQIYNQQMRMAQQQQVYMAAPHQLLTGAGGRPITGANLPAGQMMNQQQQQRNPTLANVVASGNTGLKPNQGKAPVAQAGGIRAGPTQTMPNGAMMGAGANNPQMMTANTGASQTELLLSKEPMEQKQVLGEQLFERVVNVYPDWAGKITGMLLDIDNAELLHMLESEDALMGKVNEAMGVLRAHHKSIQGGNQTGGQAQAGPSAVAGDSGVKDLTADD